jgi:glutamyl-tRNA synthetase
MDQLIAANLVYPCTCTRADVLRAASAPHADDEQPIYPGTCSHRDASEGFALDQHGKSFAWRFRAAGRTVNWTDHVRGPQSHALDRIGGDFIVARSGGVFGYQLAVVVDDAAMNVTQVVRGHDLDDSTPRQLLIQEALGLPRPEYWHVGLVLGPEGKRLAKRDQAIKLSELRVSGVLPGQILAMLGRSLGLEWPMTDRLPSPMDFLNFKWSEGDVNWREDWVWSSHRLHEV